MTIKTKNTKTIKTNQYDDSKFRKAEVLLVLTVGILALLFMLKTWVIKENISYDLISQKLLLKSGNFIKSLSEDTVLSLYLTQLSLTFITISVMSVLSDKTVTLYWINLVEDNLISPPFKCFYAYVIYSFSTITINLFALFFSNNAVFFLFFIINLIVLYLLTYSMLTVFFRQDIKEKKAIKEFQKDVKAAENDLEASKRLSSKIKKLKEYTLKAYSNNDIDTLNKNIEFYSKYCKVEDVTYFLKKIDNSNIELLGEVLLSGFIGQINEKIDLEYECLNKENIKDVNLECIKEFKDSMDYYNIINMIPQELLDNMISYEQRNEYYQFYEQFLNSARSIMIMHFEFMSGKKIIQDEIKSYNEFRHIIREGIRNLKNCGITSEEYNNSIYEYEKEQFPSLNDKTLKAFFSNPTENFYAYHEGMKELPTRTVLNVLKDAMDKGNHYFITVFISTFQQFPIFKYMCKLDESYSNNVVYSNIQKKCNEIREKGNSKNHIGEPFLNPDWINLFREIFGN